MTAEKVMDIISRFPGCAVQAADAVSAFSQVKMEDAHKLLKIPNRNVQTFGFVHRSTNGQNHGSVWKTKSLLSKGICTVTLWQDYYGKGNLRKFYWNTYGKSCKVKMFLCQTSTRTILISVCGRYQRRQNRKHETDLESSHERR